MREYKIYTAGKMGGWSYETQMGWRKCLEHEVKDNVQYTGNRVKFFHPPEFYTYDSEYKVYQSEKEVQTWDLNHIAESDIVAVYLQDIETSIGTLFELGFIHHLNQYRDKQIYVIGIGGDSGVKELHPWISMEMHRVEKTINDAAEYITDYLII
ncbi:MAG: hypothetical protein KH231_07725 [Dialister sp.]|uniref:hypothetical protein n=1 Tax=Dialister sp. TaxID=1955814 RepID=UPI001D726368|nr:hypothetical protein [Dialister sp.]MBS6715337.1 hypothetical protein [Dialister sp.]